jgi:signal recognition particle receptor subunit beta
MALFNYATKEITIKIVYYGPGLSGKTTNLQYLHSILDPDTKGKLLSLATEADRTLFFDFLPVELGKIRDFSIRFQLYTVPGQVRYNATRKLVLKGADAVVFIADSQREMREQNIDSLKNMYENLTANNINTDDIPVILQYNKRDLPNILSVEELNKYLNENGKYEYKEAIAIDGTGVEDTFKKITKLVIKGITKRHRIKMQPSEERSKDIEAEIPAGEVTVSKTIPEEPVPTIPIIESSRYESSGFEETKFEKSEIIKEPVQAVAEQETAIPQKVIVKEIKEVPVIPLEKLDMIINGLTEISQTLKELKSVASRLHLEVKDVKKEQKEMNVLIKDIRNNFENIKTKKSWFSFS